ncbi:hypothetical protein G3O08_16695 [Cryomorpha ignava]|uniref:VanZ-like domain-containing protein n=1 Tax=Cryomorpha ignava TaxID=101383 RepID=A0A7K3WVR1_9FLAO|nr:VanZ family protein [Cryomorpha ignava]NEN25141.1 hypothetical protein [Cryomorpha ignava]
MDKKKSFLQSYWGAALWAAFIMLLCGLPGQDLPNIDFWEIDIEDKIAHLGVFGILGFLMVYGFIRKNSQKNISRKHILILILAATAYGALTEILQGLLFPSRFASLSDFLADSLGAILGIVIAKKLLVKQR